MQQLVTSQFTSMIGAYLALLVAGCWRVRLALAVEAEVVPTAAHDVALLAGVANDTGAIRRGAADQAGAVLHERQQHDALEALCKATQAGT